MKIAKVLFAVGLGLGLAVLLVLLLSPKTANAQTGQIFFESCTPGTNDSTVVSCTIDGDGLGVWLYADFADGENGSAFLSAAISSTYAYVYSMTMETTQPNQYQQRLEWHNVSFCYQDLEPNTEANYEPPTSCVQYTGTPYGIYAYRSWQSDWGAWSMAWHFRITGVNGVPVGEGDSCINDDHNLDDSSSWNDINTPSWGTGHVSLNYQDGISQTVTLDQGSYVVAITATADITTWTPLTVSLSPDLYTVIDIWPGPAKKYAFFGISDSGTYTLAVENADETNTVHLQYVCLMATTCANQDATLANDAYWDEIGQPRFLYLYGGGDGAVFDYMEGLKQEVSLDTGVYRVDISATLPASFPVESSAIEMCIDSSCAVAQVVTDTYTTAEFNILGSGGYDFKFTNLSTDSMFPTETLTVSYVCLTPITNECIVTDPDLDNIKIQSSDTGGWHTMFDDVPVVPILYPNRVGARLLCDKSVEQWVYLDAGVYTMTLVGQGDWDNWWTRLPGQLTVNINSADPTGEYRTYYIDFDVFHGLSVIASTVTKELVFEIVESGDYLIQFANYDCEHGLFAKTGVVFIDYVCLDQDGDIDQQVGQCSTLNDASFSGYDAQSWNKAGSVDWSPGYVNLPQGASVGQTVQLSTTATMTNTEWLVYVVAKSTYTSTLRAGLGASTEDLTIVPQVRSTDYATYTAVITSTMPVVASLLAVTTTGGIDIDFFCVYHPEDVPEGEWSNGADGDTECIEPVSPVLALPGGDDSDELGLLEWIKAVLVYIWDWIKVIWEWIDYGICLMVLWLRKIWLALDAMLSGLVVTLGLDQPVQFLYDWLMVSGYVLDLMLQLAERLFAILGRAMTLVFTPFAFIALGLGFLATLLGSFWDAFSTPCDPLSLPVPTPVIKGFVLVMSLIEQIDTIGVVTSFLIGLMGIAMVIWTVGQFRNFAGGSSE